MDTPEQILSRRFASLIDLAERARATFVRFPLSVLAALAAAAAVHYNIEYGVASDQATQAVLPAIMVAILGIPFFYSLRVLGESRGWSRRVRLGLEIAGLVALVAYYMIMPTPVKGADAANYFLLLTATILASSFLPFLGRPGEQNGFWQYNKVMLLRLAAAVLYSIALYAGLSLALGACDVLLGFDVDPEAYVQLFYWVTLPYGTWFFLAGIPEDVRGLQEVRDYPTGLRVFSQYVLIPLVALYLIILYAYMVKIIVQWELPDGWVGFPVIGVTVSGMLALLLVYPIREQAESRWIARYAKFFFWPLYPLIVLISVAIWTRISDYGITEKRYLVVAASAWLLGITLYFTLRRARDIRVIPVSLCIVSLLAAFGPWSATSFARRSQLGRLSEILNAADELLLDGKLDAKRKALPFEQKKEISDIVQYVITFHGPDRIRDWYAEPERLPDDLTAPIAMQEMGLDYISRWQQEPEALAIHGPVPNPLQVAGFDYVYELDRYFGDEPSEFECPLDAATMLTLDGMTLRLGPADDPSAGVTVDLTPLLSELGARELRGESYGREETTLELESERYHCVIYLSSARLSGAPDSLKLQQFAATVLVDLK
ncbi:MAG: DUF4153 domain-containing protein [Gemmatimonadota bacterium]|nr:MAG: DUF4153 domain-containing protein [Gemmatimonadota bacterium]